MTSQEPFPRFLATQDARCLVIGGADRVRTDDLRRAKPALSQLSYSPLSLPLRPIGVVGLGRIELPTSPLSGVRSNRLSYRPSERQLHRALSAGLVTVFRDKADQPSLSKLNSSGFRGRPSLCLEAWPLTKAMH